MRRRKKEFKNTWEKRTWKALGQITMRENTNGGISFYFEERLLEKGTECGISVK
jgi:hypothetical protein